jgi:hypothetical protein
MPTFHHLISALHIGIAVPSPRVMEGGYAYFATTISNLSLATSEIERKIERIRCILGN